MCPAMTAGPIAPGRELPVYQPATDVLAGTWSAPVAVRPRRISVVLTAIAGMSSDTGAGSVTGSVAGTVAGTVPVNAAGRAAGEECLVSTSPPTPIPVTVRPRTS